MGEQTCPSYSELGFKEQESPGWAGGSVRKALLQTDALGGRVPEVSHNDWSVLLGVVAVLIQRLPLQSNYYSQKYHLAASDVSLLG